MRPFSLCSLVVVSSTLATPLLAAPAPIPMERALVLPRTGTGGRIAIRPDALELALVQDAFRWPSAGDALALADGSTVRWSEVEADEKGWLEHDALRGGWAAWTVSSPSRHIALLEAAGHSMVRVGETWRTGDPYGLGFVALPVRLRKGENRFLFRVGRGRLRARLVSVGSAAVLREEDALLPDAVRGEALDAPAGIVVLNATGSARSDLRWRARVGDADAVEGTVPTLPALGMRKTAMRLRAPAAPAAGELPVRIELLAPDGGVLDTVELAVPVREPHATRRVTFLSAIDGSVQYWALNPARPRAGDAPPGLLLTVHGAGVQADGQARAYGSKRWAHVVAPTNRRPFGFDWEDWGRLDALEVLGRAKATLGTDPHRTWLTGHSMGGHGTWHLGVTFPDRWAAIAPSAGWISFWSYAGGGERPTGRTAAEELLLRACGASDTLALVRNLAPLGVYVLHGADDDNVPVEQARRMKEVLGEFHRDVRYHEEPGKGHWWNVSDEPGADCVDWPPLLDFVSRRAIASLPRDVDFTTADPGVSADAWWVRIHRQRRPLLPSRATLRVEPHSRRFAGSTENVAVLALDLEALAPGDDVSVELDGTALSVPPTGERLYFERGEDGWASIAPPSADRKGPHRNGGFKSAFDRQAVLVHGTQGSPAENAWALGKARLDAETFWYRANGSLDVVADTVFDPGAEPDRNVVLYGNADTNAAWGALLGDSPVRVEAERVHVGRRALDGADLAALLVRPRPGSAVAVVGAVAGTGLAGFRLTDRMPYFVSGIGYSDVLVVDSRSLLPDPAGVRAAGWFGADWDLAGGEIAVD